MPESLAMLGLATALIVFGWFMFRMVSAVLKVVVLALLALFLVTRIDFNKLNLCDNETIQRLPIAAKYCGK